VGNWLAVPEAGLVRSGAWMVMLLTMSCRSVGADFDQLPGQPVVRARQWRGRRDLDWNVDVGLAPPCAVQSLRHALRLESMGDQLVRARGRGCVLDLALGLSARFAGPLQLTTGSAVLHWCGRRSTLA